MTKSVYKQQLNPDYSFKQWLNYTINYYTYTYNANGANTTQVCDTGNPSAAPSNPGAPYQVSVSGTSADSWDLDGSWATSLGTSYQYNSYGNPTQIATSTQDGVSNATFLKTVTNTYDNDITHWFLGRLTNATVTSTNLLHP